MSELLVPTIVKLNSSTHSPKFAISSSLISQNTLPPILTSTSAETTPRSTTPSTTSMSEKVSVVLIIQLVSRLDLSKNKFHVPGISMSDTLPVSFEAAKVTFPSPSWLTAVTLALAIGSLVNASSSLNSTFMTSTIVSVLSVLNDESSPIVNASLKV